ncbi:MAG: YgiT-type zinc finger protein [Candidatus Schekmanbacteria bacterium]|nr:YgiT-type zinc finger protein [Candidatus Schekmanbacteria bacterium]
MQCADCGGEFVKKTITYDQPWGDNELYIFENVPALVCSQCDAVYLEAKASQAIDAIIQSRREPKKYKKVPVFSLEEALA